MLIKGIAVYEVVGWFGDQEWSEGLWADREEAESACAQLWAGRASEKGPDYARGLHKFGVEERLIR